MIFTSPRVALLLLTALAGCRETPGDTRGVPNNAPGLQPSTPPSSSPSASVTAEPLKDGCAKPCWPECDQPIQCTKRCGGPIVQCDCCRCAPGFIDASTCGPPGRPAPGSGVEGAACQGVGGHRCNPGLVCATPGGPTPQGGHCARPGTLGAPCQATGKCDPGLVCKSLPGDFEQCEPITAGGR